MGQQQLLLIVLGVIIVGIAIVVGINLFQASAVQSNRDAVVADLNNLASQAQMYYKKPASLGGGGNKYTGFTIPTGMSTNANGTYTIDAAADAQITIVGEGMETGNDNSGKIKYTITVKPTVNPSVALNN